MGETDIRWPIGLIFDVYGVVLIIYGAVANPEMFAEKSMGVNIDLWWGVAMLAFGLLMTGFAFAASRRRPQ
jgi:hypothetical protein